MKKSLLISLLVLVPIMLSACASTNKDTAESGVSVPELSTKETNDNAASSSEQTDTLVTDQESVAETESKTEKEPYILLDTSSLPDYAQPTDDYDNWFHIDLEKISDNEYKTADGRFDVTFDYEVDDNNFYYYVKWTNISDQAWSFDFRPIVEVRTDLTDPSKNISHTSLFKKETLEPGETGDQSGNWELEEGYNSLTAEIYLTAQSVKDDNGVVITYGTNPAPLVINYSK